MLPIALSTWMRRDAIERPLDTSSAGNCFLPSRKGGRFSSAPRSLNMSSIVKPWSAIIDTPGLIFSRKLDKRVSSGSDSEPR